MIKKINYFYEELGRLEESLTWLEEKIESTTSEKDLFYLYKQIQEEKRKQEISASSASFSPHTCSGCEGGNCHTN